MGEVSAKEGRRARNVVRRSIRGLRKLRVEIPVEIDDAAEAERDGNKLYFRCLYAGASFMIAVPPCVMPL